MPRANLCRVLLLSTLVISPHAVQASDALSFFNNWFVTGDYAVAGVGLRGTGVNGWATGAINMTGVPSNAEPIAAFLYWSTVETSLSPGARNGYFDGNEIQAAVLGSQQNPNPACAVSGGVIAPAGTNGFAYRADVLRYMPVNASNIRQANGTHTVKLPDAGVTGTNLLTNGVSLIVIYRIVEPGEPLEAPLRSVVIYNSAFSTAGHGGGITQNIAGFYQAATTPGAKLTAIVANGQAGFTSQLSANGQSLTGHPLVGAQGPRWDNPTYNFGLSANASSFSVLASTGNNACLTFVAVVASLNVQDTDKDGLLDIWETKGLHRNTSVSPATFGACSDYPQEPCENLPAMGANPNKQDVFIQFDWMHGTGDGTGGIDGHGTHDHIPKLAALNSIALTFALHGISMHFDVGNNYQGAQSACGNTACSFIIPAAYAKGGSDIDEATLVCHDTLTHTCDYHQPYPVLSFEFGFASVRDGNQLLGISRHFAQDRYWAFHYALLAHALAGPFDANGHPVNPFTGQPQTAPLSYSGIAHRPGGGFMVTLGLWRSDIPANDQAGSALVQSGTFMHEWGHNADLGHAGLNTKPNCMPDYPSVMNYAYQTRGLTDAAGNEHIDYSYGGLLPLYENALSQLIPMGLQTYRVRFFGPLAPNQPTSQAAQVHCDGTPIKAGEPRELRLEGSAISTPDWSNGTNNWKKVPLIASDANYNGVPGELFADQPDWFVLNLQQIGSGYSFGGLSVGALATDGGVFATDGGAFATDAGALATDGGVFATDGGAFATDGGAFATDGGVFATDGGALATDGGAFATDAGELDYATVILSGAPAVPFGSLTATNTVSSIILNWLPPDTGAVQNYNVYRCAVVAPATSCTPSFFNTAPGGTPTPTFTDTVSDFVDAAATCPATATCYNTTYMYYVTALIVVGTNPPAESGASNTVSSEVTHLFVIAGAQVAAYGSPIPAPAFAIYGDVKSSLQTNSVTCSYSPGTPKNAGVYPVICSGPATTSSTDAVTYNAAYLGNVPGSLTITPFPVTITAAVSNKTYDGTTSSTALSTMMPAALPYGDTLILSETYDNPNVGNAHSMTPSAAAGAGTLLSNYRVTPVNSNAGVITPAQLTITAQSKSKTYGITLAFAGTEFITTTLHGSDTVTSVTLASAGAAASSSVGNYPVIPSAATGSGLSNYTISYANGTLTVNPAPLTIRANNANKIYGTALAFAGTEFTTTTLYNSDTVTSVTLGSAGATAIAIVGSYPIIPSAALGTGLTNYAITYANGALTVTPFPLTVIATGINKNFDGTTSATVTLSDNRVFANDSFTDSYAVASFADPNPGTSKPVSVTGITIFGPAAGNYVLTSATAMTTANISNSIDLSSLSLNGVNYSANTAAPPIWTGSALQLTNNTSETASAWLSTAIPVASGFNMTFQFQIAPITSPPADGFAFVIQSAPSPAAGSPWTGTGNTVLGTTGMGGYIGYTGIPNSIAIEFDTYYNSNFNDPVCGVTCAHIGIQSLGTNSNSPDHGSAANLAGPVLSNFADGGTHTATITYDGTNLTVAVDGTTAATAAINLGTLLGLNSGPAYVGFTAATGAASEYSNILSWSYSPTP